MDWRIPLADLDYDAQEEQAVLEVVHSRWLTMGAVTLKFEQEFADYVGVKHALAVSNATVALHLACRALGIGVGDEVIVPSLSFVATSNTVLYTGADVRFADIASAQDLTLSPQSVEKQITSRTRAIMVMHYGGFPCQMDAIVDLAKRYRLYVIEDAAHAVGSFVNGQALGTLGDVGCFSFFSNKNLSTGEGGMLVTNRDDLADHVRLMRSHGMTTLTWDRHQGHAYSYDVVELGYNYRIDEIRSALGRVQLRKLEKNNQRRREIARRYWQAFKRLPVDLPFCDRDDRLAYHLFPLVLPAGVDRLRFIDAMRAEGIQTSIHYPPIHQFSYYRQLDPKIQLPLTENIAAREVTLPLYPGMTDEMVELVISAVQQSLDKASARRD